MTAIHRSVRIHVARPGSLTQPIRNRLLWPGWLLAPEVDLEVLVPPPPRIGISLHEGSCHGGRHAHRLSRPDEAGCPCCSLPPRCPVCSARSTPLTVKYSTTNTIVLQTFVPPHVEVSQLLTMIASHTGIMRCALKLLANDRLVFFKPSALGQL